MTKAIARAAKSTGANFDYLLATAKVESDLDPNLTMRTSTATGLFQFPEQTFGAHPPPEGPQGEGERAARSSLNRFILCAEKANAMLVPDFRSGAGEPVSFLPLEMRGVARREGALSGFRRTARLLGRTQIAGPLAHMTRAPASLDAPRGITAFAFTASRTEPAVFVPRGGFPSAARGGGLR